MSRKSPLSTDRKPLAPRARGPARSGTKNGDRMYEATSVSELTRLKSQDRMANGNHQYSSHQLKLQTESLEDEEGDTQQLISDFQGPKEYTIQEFIDHNGLGWFQYKLSITTGLAWMAESMEMMLLSILGPVLSCHWYLPSWQQALLTTVVMTGTLLGSSYWGAVTDKYGRKTALTMATIMIGYFGFLSSFTPTYVWMALTRFLVGCALAAVPQTAVLFSEYLPTKHRPAGLLLMAVFWAVGAAVEVVLAMLVMPTLGWRYLMAFSALPVLIFPMSWPWLPESARYYLACGRRSDVDRMLDMVAKDNNRPALPGKLADLNTEPADPGQIKDVFSPPYRRLCCLVTIIWFFNGLLYFGQALLLPTVLNKPDGCHGNDIKREEKVSCSASCEPFSQSDYLDLVAIAFADMPGLAIAFVMLQYLGRKASIAVTSFLGGLFLFFGNICMSRLNLTMVLFVVRAMIAGSYQMIIIYTTECYPTKIRAIGMGVAAMGSKSGALITPFIAQVLIDYSAYATFTAYGVAAVVAAVLTLLLPFDTRGRAMMDS